MYLFMEEYEVRLPFGVGRRMPKSNEFPNGWEELKIQNIDILNSKKPVILCFGGNGTIQPSAANYNSKLLESFIGNKSANIYSFYYGYSNAGSKRTGDLLPEEIDKIYENLISPLIFDDSNKPYSQQKIANNLDKVTFVTHCMGNVYANALVLKTMKELQTKGGFAESDAKQLISHFFNVSYAPYYVPNSKNYMTQFEFETMRDRVNTDNKARYEDENENIPYFRAGFLKRRDENTLALVANSFVDFDIFIDEHAISTIELDNGVSFGKTHDQRNLTIANCFGLALSYAVLNKNRDLTQLQPLIQNELDKENNAEWEKRQTQLYEWERTGGEPVEIFMAEHGISEAQLVNGEVNLQDMVPSYKDNMGFTISKRINYKDSNYKENYNLPLFGSKSKGQAIEANKPLYFDGPISLKYLISSDGHGANISLVINKDDIVDNYIRAKIHNQSLDNSVVASISQQSEDATKNTMNVSRGKKFKDKVYSTFAELKESLIPSIEQGKRVELTPEQTRVILNEAIRRNVPFQNITLEKGLSLNHDVIHNEIKIDDDRIINITKPPEEMQH